MAPEAAWGYAGAMALRRITLGNFRNHADTRLDEAGVINILIGENGAGKTNILEAISLLAPGRGLRRAPLAEMPGPDRSGFALSASISGAGGPVTLGTAVKPAQPQRRVVQVNGAQASAASLAEWLAMGWLTPAMDGLFVAAAADRRRYLDRLALALFPDHARIASRYEAALRERNRLLGGEEAPDPRWLAACEEPLAQAGALLSGNRAALVEALAGELDPLADAPFARPALAYRPGGPLDAAALLAALRAGRGRERAAGRTLTGPHRDELEVSAARTGAPAARCSTGEQKALLLALTLAHAALSARGRPAILLLDEVAAHLDPVRRGALFERLRGCGAQVWLTGTEAAAFGGIIGEAAVWRIEAGTAMRC